MSEYAWATQFTMVGAQIGNVDTTTAAAEYVHGHTAMGFRPRPVAEDKFSASYVLVSRVYGKNRFSARYDWFSTTDTARVYAFMILDYLA